MEEWDQWVADNRSLEMMRQIALDAMSFGEGNDDAFYDYAEEHDLTMNEVAYYLNACEYGGEAGLEAIRRAITSRVSKAPHLYLDRSDFGQIDPICRFRYTGGMSNWEVVIFKWSTAREKERMRQEETFCRAEEKQSTGIIHWLCPLPFPSASATIECASIGRLRRGGSPNEPKR